MVYKWLDSIQDRLFPARCRLCLAPGTKSLELCAGCIADLPRLVFACERCGRAVPGDGLRLCGRCLAEPPAFDHCRALFVYEYPVDYLIHRIKYSDDLALARSLGNLLAERVDDGPVRRPDRVIPVPMHHRRLGTRGYNQALELARPLRRRGYNLDPDCCVRTRATAEQPGLSAAERRQNVRRVFAAQRSLQGEIVAVVDDVMTTGSTLDELASCLKRAGASRVDVWVIARTLRD